jgi:hypothetical protein
MASTLGRKKKGYTKKMKISLERSDGGEIRTEPHPRQTFRRPDIDFQEELAERTFSRAEQQRDLGRTKSSEVSSRQAG